MCDYRYIEYDNTLVKTFRMKLPTQNRSNAPRERKSPKANENSFILPVSSPSRLASLP